MPKSEIGEHSDVDKGLNAVKVFGAIIGSSEGYRVENNMRPGLSWRGRVK